MIVEIIFILVRPFKHGLKPLEIRFGRTRRRLATFITCAHTSGCWGRQDAHCYLITNKIFAVVLNPRLYACMCACLTSLLRSPRTTHGYVCVYRCKS